jgi:hypothetical protein
LGSGGSVAISCTGSDSVSIGNSGSLANVGGTISVSGAKSLLIDDASDTSANGFTLTNNAYNDYYVTFGNTYIFYDTLGSLTLSGGPGGNTFEVDGTAAPVTLNTGGGTNSVYLGGASAAVNIVDQATQGIDAVKIGTNGTLSSIAGAVNISQTSGSQAAIALTIEDQDDMSSRTFDITSNKVSVSGLPMTINFQGVNLSSMTFDDSWFYDNTFDFESKPTGINTVTVYTKRTHDKAAGWYASDVYFVYPQNPPFPLPSGLILINPDGTNLGLAN